MGPTAEARPSGFSPFPERGVWDYYPWVGYECNEATYRYFDAASDWGAGLPVPGFPRTEVSTAILKKIREKMGWPDPHGAQWGPFTKADAQRVMQEGFGFYADFQVREVVVRKKRELGPSTSPFTSIVAFPKGPRMRGPRLEYRESGLDSWSSTQLPEVTTVLNLEGLQRAIRLIDEADERMRILNSGGST